ncbi:hypothetical protein EC917_112126 [Bacillus thuringiensis]|uniref:Uncharacterized protein n=1 Tax=Bacillus thuringiensis TaxID=1428 RepID=A0A4R4BBX8_BACTU|nr:hypothetical protein [Bacillus thuringiensis]TCW53007.1 hypothetical protein EC917_112126 [Bacillus thuringiensis]TCW53177.1 hypothetical protein EC910_112126 [Bacillus thuringiensis]
MNLFPMRIAVVAPAAPSTHVASGHGGTPSIGIESPATWQHLLQYPSYGQYGMQPGYTPFTPTLPSSPVIYQYHYHFPALYFQEFHGTFNI